MGEEPDWKKNPQILISELGSPKYQIRESAQRKLLYLDNKVLPLLKENYDHEDLEVKLRVRYILDQFQYVKPERGEWPMIWCLPNEYRFVNNVWNEELQSFTWDAAKYYFDKEYIRAVIERGANDWSIEVQNYTKYNIIHYEPSDGPSARPFSARTATTAMEIYIRIRRIVDGISKQEAQKIIEQTQLRQRDMFFIKQERLDPHPKNTYFRLELPLSVMLKEPLTEGTNR